MFSIGECVAKDIYKLKEGSPIPEVGAVLNVTLRLHVKDVKVTDDGVTVELDKETLCVRRIK